ncbi:MULTISPECIES: PAC2 family protein [Bifidobacterium]|uniref:PAC2 family protein n=1 Tax=Bifidobacterium asteroides TaxID=1684 RepID=A0A318MKB8_9BIFI|nr:MULTISPECIES: PAC2 family protein [Bifidobacterium]MBI0063579.1 PAC2 family protein [Bifidobacterium polysaccharolyticum]MBI0086042.1 PAC2 family protein [Bifidobacterium sp. M0404]MBI0145181.1 PAC2 family protein [Bifidobacterium polysaccharolyticum]MBI0152004.1 PAC2 family protein [Bifidobacterium sp. M0399]MCP8614432.1 PAC2 family protein [Bifidobacterium asteroides]
MSEEARQHCTMVAAFDGWNDACSASTNVIRHLLNVYESHEIGSIPGDGFYDYQMSRPMLCHVQGRRRIIWPSTKIYRVQIDDTHTLLLEMGPEPNYHWSDFCRRSIHWAEDDEAEAIITLGAMFADCPHTRPLPIDDLAGDQPKTDTDGHSGPIGIPTVLDALATQDGYSTESIWVSVPQYLGSDECAQGTLQLLQRLSAMLGVHLDEGELPRKAAEWKAQAGMLLRCNDDLANYVHRLEMDVDQAQVDEPAAEELVREAEDYLRSMGNKGPSLSE